MQRIGCFIAILIVVGGLFAAYDYYRLQPMRSSVQAISTKLGMAGPGDAASAQRSDLVTALAEAERHTRSARQLLKQRKTEAAQAQLDKALASLKDANAVSSGMVADAAGFLGKAKDNAVKVFQKAWRDISEEAAK